MKRDFLEGLLKGFEATEESIKKVVEQIMETNGSDVEAAKKEMQTITADRDKYKEQLSVAQEAVFKYRNTQ